MKHRYLEWFKVTKKTKACPISGICTDKNPNWRRFFNLSINDLDDFSSSFAFKNQFANLVQNYWVKAWRNKYQIILSTVLFAVAILLPSFTVFERLRAIPSVTLVPGLNVFFCSGNSIETPEFLQKADSVVVPLKRAGRLFLIEAKVDGETGNLVFDTGANGLVLNSTYFRNHVKSGGTVSTGITGSDGAVEQVAVGQLEFADIRYTKLTADVANLGHIENRRGAKIIGLIGFSLLRSMEVIIDPRRGELRLYKVDKSGNRVNSGFAPFRPDLTQKIEGNSNILFLTGTVGGKVLNFCFDTGAETNAISSDSNKKVMNTISITHRAALKGAGAAGSEVLFGRMNDFAIGSRKIADMETVITNLDALSEAYGTHIDGMLGSSFIEHGVFCVNFLSGQFGMRFTKGEER